MRHLLYSVSIAVLASLCVPTGGHAADPDAPLTYQDIGLRSFIGVSPDYSDKMLDWQWHVTEKAVAPLDSLASGELKTGKLYIGALARASANLEHTNTFGKFPLLGQFPTGHKKQNRAGEWILNNAHIGLTYAPTDWMVGFVEAIYTDLTYPGQENFQVRKAFVTVGDLKRLPIYASFGKNLIDFGDMRAFNPFVHTMTAHYFNAQAEDAQFLVGYKQDGWHVTATAFGGGRQLRVADSDSPRGSIGNFALNASKTFEFGDGIRVKLGGGYLDSTIYNTPVAHHTSRDISTAGERIKNGAWDVNGMVSYRGFDVQAEYTCTTTKWPAADSPVSALTVQGRYTTTLMGWTAVVSGGFSRGEQGQDGTPWHEMRQWVAGLEIKPHKQLSLAAEYVHSSDFVPLVRIQQSADPRVKSDTWTLGARVHF